MTFNTAVSGLRAANSQLGVVGNNIANASTTGFKSSRAEFSDVYATSAVGAATNSIGSGVLLGSVKQQFTQGNISFTNNSLDMAINGEGFFIIDNDGGSEYTRSGLFGIDQEGFLVTTGNRRLQGFQANDEGSISGNLSSLQVSTDNLSPRQTSAVDTQINLDASETTPAESGTTASTLGAAVGAVQAGNNNAYPAEDIEITLSDGSIRTIATAPNASAAEISSSINALPEVSSTATTTATISNISDNGALEISLNGVTLVTSQPAPAPPIDAQDIAIAINQLTNTTLRGITAIQNAAGDEVTITSTTGADLRISIAGSPSNLDSITVQGTTANTLAMVGDNTNGNGLTATVGGSVDITLEEDVTVAAFQTGTTTPADGTGLFEAAIGVSPFINNSFSPTDQDTYNHATSVSIFDSLGNSHVMSLFFVKESTENTWTMYVQVDGEDVGDPNRALDPPLDLEPTQASYNLVFNNDGTLDEGSSDPVQITYWNPIDAEGNANGALSGLPLADGAVFPVTQPFSNSNFEIDVMALTQFGSNFSVNDISQDGNTTGRISGIDISSEGLILSRYTNGQSLILGQVALANFRNTQGLQPIGNTSWAETFDSGNPVVGAPGSAALGVLQAGALEDSNVELSQELVQLIVAQRNFQANAKTIQTADTVTQAIINIR